MKYKLIANHIAIEDAEFLISLAESISNKCNTLILRDSAVKGKSSTIVHPRGFSFVKCSFENTKQVFSPSFSVPLR